MDRKIVEFIITGIGVNEITRMLPVGKNRIRELRHKAEAAGYILADGQRGEVSLPPYPERVFPDPVFSTTGCVVIHETMRGSARIRAVTDMLAAFLTERKSSLSGKTT